MEADWWKYLEKEVAYLTGGKRTPGSGNKGIKGDIRIPISTGYITIECKLRSFDKPPLKSRCLPSAWFETANNLNISIIVFLAIYKDVKPDGPFYYTNLDLENIIEGNYISPDNNWKQVDKTELIWLIKNS